jgi:Fe-Mn family superoxide dismutase
MSDEKKTYFTLPALPYARDALKPHISEETINFHYGKHHQGYVNILNDLAAKDSSLQKGLDDLVRGLDAGKPFNMAAQIWNHTFYWNSLSPNGGGKPTGDIAKLIDSSFGSFTAFQEKFSAEAAGHFGSGWAWLVLNKDGKLEVNGTHDAGNPLAKNGSGSKPLLVCDVWEHAYYIDYRNARADYIKGWWSLVNWNWANDQLAAAAKSKM